MTAFLKCSTNQIHQLLQPLCWRKSKKWKSVSVHNSKQWKSYIQWVERIENPLEKDRTIPSLFKLKRMTPSRHNLGQSAFSNPENVIVISATHTCACAYINGCVFKNGLDTNEISSLKNAYDNNNWQAYPVIFCCSRGFFADPLNPVKLTFHTEKDELLQLN